jgi:hypothetical protein
MNSNDPKKPTDCFEPVVLEKELSHASLIRVDSRYFGSFALSSTWPQRMERARSASNAAADWTACVAVDHFS